ncbi:glycosyltransferase 87 family protein [Streptomyces malaysiensis]|uniref:Glycosyltransferase 87 family protein n=1 Tax=Streptomyces malaysiensis subsp. samsunensis TaxID=459658 RepID=A0A9X2M6U8_STRMQ|nr:glycosyltransferase 87 family protein [Streptomyces samsunensis]MCQ8836214.1 glycosyltransferase 87 family protein [Streptomyces samsunensis]
MPDQRSGPGPRPPARDRLAPPPDSADEHPAEPPDPPSRARTTHPWIAPVTLATLLGSLVAVLALTFRGDDFHTAPGALSLHYAIAWTLFAAAAWTVRRLGARQAAVFVLVGGAAVAATGLLAPPRTSTDAYRYAWDGRVQAAGISPYDYAPEDPALASLRDRWLFPKGPACHGPDRAPVRPAPERPKAERPEARHPTPERPAPGSAKPGRPIPGGPALGGTHPHADPAPDHAHSAPGSAEPQCTRLNRPSVHTIYPPAAEGYFLLVHRSAPSGSTLLPLQTGGALLSLATTAVLLAAARRRRDPRLATARAALWAWCPAVPVEAVNNAHVDALGVLLTVAGLIAVPRRRALGGALLGAATAAKLLPAVALPGALSGVLARATGPGAPRTTARRTVLEKFRPTGPGRPAPAESPPPPPPRDGAGSPAPTASRIRRAAAVVLPRAAVLRPATSFNRPTASAIRPAASCIWPAASCIRPAASAVLPVAAAAAVVALGYLPYVLLSRSSVLGYLTGYVAEEGYETGSAAADDKNRYALLRLLHPGPETWALPVVAAVLLAVVAWVLLRGDPQRPWRGALVVTGTAFLLMTPGYPWYALLVVALVALDGRWEWLGVPLAGVAQYVTARAVDDGAWVGTLGYAVACAAVMAGWAVRAPRAASASRPPQPPAETAGTAETVETAGTAEAAEAADAATPGSPPGSPTTRPRRRRARR